MNKKYWIMVGFVFCLLLAPFYYERHLIANTLLADPHTCFGVWYTGGAPFSHCSSGTTDCYTTTNGGTVCTHTDSATLIAIGGLGLVAACVLLFSSIVITYPFGKRLGWL